MNAQHEAAATVAHMASHAPRKLRDGYVPTLPPVEATDQQRVLPVSSAGFPLSGVRILRDNGIRTLGQVVDLTALELRGMCAAAGNTWEGMRILYVLAGRHRLTLADGFYCDESIPADYSDNYLVYGTG